MGRCLLSSTVSTFLPCNLPKLAFPKSFSTNSVFFHHGFCSTGAKTGGAFCTKAALSNVYSKIGADSTGSIPSNELLQVVEAAAKTGAQVVMDAVNKPRNVTYKGLTDLVTDTDKSSEVAILEVVRKIFPDHLILGEEGGIIGDSSSEYLWCIDPLDGTTNFAHGYPSFAVSVGVLFRGKPAAATVVYAGIVSDVPFGLFTIVQWTSTVSYPVSLVYENLTIADSDLMCKKRTKSLNDD